MTAATGERGRDSLEVTAAAQAELVLSLCQVEPSPPTSQGGDNSGGGEPVGEGDLFQGVPALTLSHISGGGRACHVRSVTNFFFFFLVFFATSWVTPGAYGGSKARSRIGAVAAGLRQSYSNAGSELRLRPTPQLRATRDP